MTRRVARVALFGVAALIAWFALRRTAPFAPRPAELFEVPRAALSWTHPDTLERGETFEKLMQRGGVDGANTRAILAAAPMLDPRRLRAGMAVDFISDSAGAPTREIVFKLAIDSLLRVARADDGTWTATQQMLPWTTDTVVMHGAVPEGGALRSALASGADAMFPGAAREQLFSLVARVYEYRVDMSHDLRAGDSVSALVERARGPEASTRVSKVLASRLFVGGKPIDAFYFPVDSIGAKPRSKYYDATGKSLATAFLRAPIEFSRISSQFGQRFHPILKINRMHEGTDYAAASGTPVRAIADGTVIRAVYNPGGYGNMVEIRHINGIVTRYGHLRAFGRGIRSGTRVSQGQTIGYVGMTGLATAPHLHFEVLVAGRQTNPVRALRSADGTPLPQRDKPLFDQARALLAGLLSHSEGVVRLAQVR